MLKHKLVRVGITVTTLSLLAALSLPAVSFASGGGNGGTGSASDGNGTVNVSAGQLGNSGIPAEPGGITAGNNSGDAAPPPACPNYVPYSAEYPGSNGGPPAVGANPNGAWYMNTCAVGTQQTMGTGLIWVVNGQPPPPPPPDPAVVAAQAGSQLQLATPTLTFSPAANAYVKFPEWLAINATIWHPFTTSATACNAGGCTTVTATATPTYVTWDTGDPVAPTVCNYPGTPYRPNVPFSEQSTQCSHTYEISSYGQPSPDGNPNDAAFPIIATVVWNVTWAGPAGSTGQLAAIRTQGTSTLKVEQIESVQK
jgi:hypothetical protein